MSNFSPKRASETEIFTVDFAPWLGPGETLLGPASWTITCCDGIDPNAAAMLVGVASITGTMVSQIIAGGVPFATYAPICTVQTSAGQTLIGPEQGIGLLYISG